MVLASVCCNLGGEADIVDALSRLRPADGQGSFEDYVAGRSAIILFVDNPPNDYASKALEDLAVMPTSLAGDSIVVAIVRSHRSEPWPEDTIPRWRGRVFLDRDKEVFRRLVAPCVVPAYVFIDETGRVFLTKPGYLPRQRLMQIVECLVRRGDPRLFRPVDAGVKLRDLTVVSIEGDTLSSSAMLGKK
jgi:hypothetical protein